MFRSTLDLGSIAPLNDDYLAEIEADLDRAPEKPKKKTKAEKRAERKEKKRLLAIDEKKLVLRDQLRCELELSKRVEKKHFKDWEEMCGELKIVELREELQEWSKEVRRNLERKNFKVEQLLEDIDGKMELQDHLFSKTLEIVDYVQRCYTELLKTQKDIYESQSVDLMKMYYEDIKRQGDEVDAMHDNTDKIIHASNFTFIVGLKTDFANYENERLDRVNTQIENRFLIRDSVCAKMKQVYGELTNFIAALTNTDLDVHKYDRMHVLTDRQHAFQAGMEALKRDELNYKLKIKSMKEIMLRNETHNTQTINDLRLELEYFRQAYHRIEYDRSVDRHITYKKLKVLTTECYNLNKMIEKYTKKAELLQSLAISCYQLQTKNEKVVLGGELPDYPLGLKDVDEHFKMKTLDLEKHLDIHEDALVKQNQFMESFWRRHAMVEAQNLMLVEEKRKLSAENQKYIDFIKSLTVQHDDKSLAETIDIKPCAVKTQCDPPACTHYKLSRRAAYNSRREFK